MFLISFKTLCRKCFHSLPGLQMLNITGSDISEYSVKTDFEVMQEVENYGLEVRCNNCNSDNLQLYDFSINDYELFDFKRISKDQNLHFFALKIEKLFDDDFKTEISGKQVEETLFLIACLRDSMDRLNAIPNENFLSHTTGFFSIIYTGTEDLKKIGYDLNIQKLIYYGISKKQLIENINNKMSSLIFGGF